MLVQGEQFEMLNNEVAVVFELLLNVPYINGIEVTIHYITLYPLIECKVKLLLKVSSLALLVRLLSL